MSGGRGANDPILLVCRWCDKSHTPVTILRAAWPVFVSLQTWCYMELGCITVQEVNCVSKQCSAIGSVLCLVIASPPYERSTFVLHKFTQQLLNFCILQCSVDNFKAKKNWILALSNNSSSDLYHGVLGSICIISL